jgi:hypothetical protein
MGSWGDGELGEMGSWGSWGAGELGSWGAGERGETTGLMTNLKSKI